MNKYEALGHYTELSETLATLKEERSFLVSELTRAAQRLEQDFIDEAKQYQRQINLEAPEKNLAHISLNTKKITEIQARIAELKQQINHYAQICGKPQV